MNKKINIAIIRGGGDLATGTAYTLFNSGYNVVILEVEKPLAVRRKVAFCEAVYEGEAVVEGIKAVLAKDKDDIYRILNQGNIPVYVDKNGSIIKELNPLILIDSIIAKRNIGTSKDMAPITIGIGPGFEAGVDVDLVVESNRGSNLGNVIHKGKAEDNTGIPGEVMGYTTERVLRAPCNGIITSFCKIGDTVKKGDVLAKVGNEVVTASIDGTLRGMIKDGLYVKKGLKIGDIDPRGIREYAFTISDKARTIGEGVLEGIQYMRNIKNI